MAGVLTIGQFLGGPDEIPVEQVFPSSQKTLIYDFNRDITGWTIEADYQTLIVDTIKFNRFTGEPNFSGSQVIGSFPKQEITGALAPQIIDAATGRVYVHIPANMYPGPIIPDARRNVPIVIVGVTWNDNQTPVQRRTHRWAFIQNYEPDVTIGDPTAAVGYVAFS